MKHLSLAVAMLSSACSVGDSTALIAPASPTSASEACDTYDDDGDGQVDEGCLCARGGSSACYPGPRGTEGIGVCRAGTMACAAADAEFGSWGSCAGAVTPEQELCGNGLDEDCDGADLPCGPGQKDAGPKQADLAPIPVPACSAGATQSCYSGPQGTAGKGPCKAGGRTCQPNGSWGPCLGESLPQGEICNNWIDEDCDGKDELCPGTIAVNLSINGDCVTAACPPNAPHPVGCNINFVGNDNRGCVANAPGSPIVYFQEGDKCMAGYLSGTLYCSSTAGAPLNATNCPINKSIAYYPAKPSGCPEIDD